MAAVHNAGVPTRRVLHVAPSMGYNGVSLMLMSYYRHIDRTAVQFDFVTHGPVEDFHEEIRSMGGRVFYANTARTVGFVRYVSMMRRVMLEHGPYHAVHIHTNYQSGLVALAARLAGVQTRICHIRGSYIGQARDRALLPLYKHLIFAHCTRFLACGRQAGRYYYGRRAFEVLPNAVDLSLFAGRDAEQRGAVRHELSIAPDTLVLGHVGRFSAEKNHALMLDLLARVRAKGRDWCLVLAGYGRLRPAVEQDAEARGLAASTRFLGIRKDIPRLMCAFDVLLLPSVSEGLPNVVVQAQAAGCPCVVSDTITDEVDMGLGLVRYVPLTGPLDAWEEAVMAQAAVAAPAQATIEQRIREQGFDIRESVARMLQLYLP